GEVAEHRVESVQDHLVIVDEHKPQRGRWHLRHHPRLRRKTGAATGISHISPARPPGGGTPCEPACGPMDGPVRKVAPMSPFSVPRPLDPPAVQPDTDQLAVDTLRFLAADMVEAARSGHPGMPM